MESKNKEKQQQIIIDLENSNGGYLLAFHEQTQIVKEINNALVFTATIVNMIA